MYNEETGSMEAGDPKVKELEERIKWAEKDILTLLGLVRQLTKRVESLEETSSKMTCISKSEQRRLKVQKKQNWTPSNG